MAGRLFDKLEQEAFRAGIAARTKASMEWFRSNVSNKSISRAGLIADGPTRARQVYGSMYNFSYNPKTKATLPYYDRFPMVIMVEPAPGGFYGLNLHYLAPGVRARFLDALMDTAPKKINDKSRLKLRYDLLQSTKKFKEFEPCFKRYLNSQIKGRPVRVPMSDWEIAIFLPVEQFAKVKKESVWRYSRKQYTGK